MKRRFSLLLALLMLVPAAASCADSKQADIPDTSADTAPVNTEASTEEPDPFADCNFNGKDFRISTSINAATGTLATSNNLIQGPEDYTGDSASDAAYDRNLKVMEKLNINFVYQQENVGYDGVSNLIRGYISTADDAFDLIINDLLGSAPLTVEGSFYNILECDNFDFTKPYWYSDFMQDISINYNYQYLMAGDYFIDLLRTSHCLIMNKDLYTTLYGDPNEVYDLVLNKEWTYDIFLQMIEGAYIDANGNQSRDKEDIFGYTAKQNWGPMIPFLISANPGFIERDADGYPVITVFNERSLTLLDYLKKIFKGDGSGTLSIWDDNEANWLSSFSAGRALFIGDQRLGALESSTLRETEFEIAVLPYPVMDAASDSYITSAHDTSELGMIPVTASPDSLDFISTVIEVLCRETYNDMLPIYYESALKVKYTRDNVSAQMIDIIHDNVGNSFALAWSGALNQILMQNTFYYAVQDDTDFASKYNSLKKASSKQLEQIMNTFKEKAVSVEN